MNTTFQRHTSETGGGWLLGATLAATAALLVGLGLVFFYAPLESTMGVVQKIFYFHVPSALAGYAGFIVCCGASITYVLTGSHRADVVARSGAEVGVLFMAAVLTSGPIWGYKAWGAWWTGEPRLMLTLVLWLVFVAYLIVRQVGGESEMTRKICALLGILGVADIPLVRMAVKRWRGNHPEVLSNGGGGISADMGVAFGAMLFAIALLFIVLLAHRIRVGLLELDADACHRDAALRAARSKALPRTEARA